jgi:hypothetical protein
VTYAIDQVLNDFPNIAHSWWREDNIETVLRVESSRLWLCVCIHRPEVASTLHARLYWLLKMIFAEWTSIPLEVKVHARAGACAACALRNSSIE